jgi:hypothetical protein
MGPDRISLELFLFAAIGLAAFFSSIAIALNWFG